MKGELTNITASLLRNINEHRVGFSPSKPPQCWSNGMMITENWNFFAFTQHGQIMVLWMSYGVI